MASFAFIDCRFEVNSVDLSGFTRSVTLTITADELDDTAMGDTYRSRIGGLRDWSIAAEFNADFAASATDATLNALLGTTTTVKVRPDSAAIGATNPEYSGSALINNYQPMGSSVGDLATASISASGAGTLSRATS